MSSGIKWRKSGVRKDRYYARVDGRRVVIEKTSAEWLLTEDGRKISGSRWHRALPLLTEIAEQRYTHGKTWRDALIAAEAKIAGAPA